MGTEPDPYRTLGLDPAASLDDVKRAYRRLAKVNHPDAAGEAALPRFLAIQAAYERLVGPTTGTARGVRRGTTAAPRKPWEADPDRSDATHRAYGGRARRQGETGRRPGRGSTSRAAGSARPSGGAGSPPGAGAGPAGQSRRADSGTAGGGPATRDPKKATLGSTSYDEAEREVFEPDWVGASWYGTTSGTYWTINPKEYADPRKHGPEYQARARRAARTGQPVQPVQGPGSDEAPTHSTTSWWEATSGPAPEAERPAPAAAPQRPAPGPRQSPRPAPTDGSASAAPKSPGAATPGGATSSSSAAGPSGSLRALTRGTPPSWPWRLSRALIGWIPIALAIGWASGEFTGCARFSATCDTGTAPIVWFMQAIAFAGLLALPTVARWAVIAAFVSLAVAVPATLFVTATAGATASQSGAGFLGVVLALAWLVGVTAAILLGREPSSGAAGPVS
jgi:hypothetical protein